IVVRSADAGAVSSEAPVVGADPAGTLTERLEQEIGVAPSESIAPASAAPSTAATTTGAAQESKAKSKAADTSATRKESSAEDSSLAAEQLPVVSEGDYGDVIAIVQRMLDVEPTGYFGPKTHKAVVEYQESVGLPATGQVATFTWATLGSEAVDEALTAAATPDGYVDGEPAEIQETPAEQPKKTQTVRAASTNAEPPVLEETDSGESVAVVQRALGVQPATGYFGPKTDKAVRQFQADNGIPTTGVIATYTWAALGADLAAKTAAAHEAYGTVFGPGVKDSGKNKNSGGNSGGGSSSGNGNNGGGNGGGGNSSGGAGGNGKGLFCPVANFYYGDGLGASRPGGRSHAGLDLMGSRGEPIYAIDSGTVTRSGYQSNGAMILDITGSRGMYFYGHFDKILVGYGESVKAGQLIGYMGDTGSPGAVHLHLEVRPNGWSGGYEDPVPLIKSLCG
ncbi:MAG: peptidoglycan-binding protein, partial [Candidatus Nanopelagicales bacterium]